MKKERVLKEYQQMCNGIKCIESHKKCSGCRELEGLKSQQVFGVWSTPLSELKPIEVKDIVQDLYRRARNNQNLLKANKNLLSRWYEGCVVFGSLCVDATKKGISVLTVVEAEDGTSCVVQVFNAVQASCRQDELRKMFPKGIRVAISRPSIGTLHPGVSPVVLYVQSPANMDFVGISHKALVYVAPQELRLEGNRLYTQGNYVLAIQYYTDCFSSIHGKTKDPEMKKESVLAISNRAEAWLKLCMYEKAIADANKAIDIDPLHAKSLFRKGRALMAIHEYIEARGSLKLAAKNSDGEAKKESMDALQKCKIFLQQSQKGVYDVGDYVGSGLNMDLAPNCSDYVGPVEVRFTKDGRGRGLFVTRKVKLGELLLVSNNVAFAPPIKGPAGSDTDLFVAVLRACRSSRKILHQLYALQDPSVVPQMKMFKPNVGSDLATEEEVPIEMNKIHRAVKAGHFPWTIIGQPDLKRSRVWTLPAFINHSCCPNVSKLEVGKATFIHAARDMHAGEEMLISYVDPYAPWYSERRRILFDEWGFDCSCKRCVLERANQAVLKDLPRFDDLVKEKYDSMENCTKLLMEIEDTLSSSKANLTREDKDMIRLTMFDFYGPFSVSSKQQVSKSATALKKLVTPEAMLKLLHSVAPGHPKTLVYMSYLARYRDNNKSDVYQLLMDEFTAAYGSQCTCLAFKVLQSYFEAALENLMEVSGIVEYRVCKCWFEEVGIHVECLI